MADDKPIIVIKKKGGHGGHHGGAWKVAYADFVTAMMAFFMVMWLVNSASTPTKQAIASYFAKPGLFQAGSGTPLEIGGSGILTEAAPPRPEEKKKGSGLSTVREKKKSGTDDTEADKRITIRSGDGKAFGMVDGLERTKQYMTEKTDEDIAEEDLEPAKEKEKMKEVEEQIKQMLASSPELQELVGVVDVKVEADGLNIEIMDTDKTSMFALGSAEIQPLARDAFKKIGEILAKTPNSVDIVGHTDAKPFGSTPNGYTNWELSADRANAARRLLIGTGIDAARITSVVGRADKDLKRPEDPLNASNRRITLKMRFNLPGLAPTQPLTAPDQVSRAESGFIKQREEQLKSLNKPTQATAPVAKDPVHSFTPQEILAAQRKKRKLIRLPDEKNAKHPAGSATPGKERILGDSPVVGPSDIFEGID